MPLKRKRSTDAHQKSKRVQHDPEFEEDAKEPEALPDDQYEVKQILSERKRGGHVEYLIDWEVDKRNGRSYDPEWIPKVNVNIIPRKEWKRKLAAAGGHRPFLRQQAAAVNLAESKKTRGRPKKIAAPVPAQAPAAQEQSLLKRSRGRPRKSTGGERAQAEPNTGEKLGEKADTKPVSDSEGEEAPRIRRKNSVQRRHTVGDSSPEPEENQPAPTETIQETVTSPGEILQADLAAAAFASGHSRIRITIPAATESSKAEFADFSSSPFRASEVISGTAPQPTEESADTASHPALIDAAGAPNLTQKHSQYEDSSTRSENDTTGSAVATSLSSGQTSSNPHQTQRGPVIPDSQSQVESASFVPSTQEASGSRTTSGQETQSEIKCGELVEDPTQVDITCAEQISAENVQAVPESSAVQFINQDPSVYGDTTTESAIEPERHEANADFGNDASSADEEAAVSVQAAQEPVSPSAAISITSSTSSPPPTESPDKTQSTDSQLQSQQDALTHYRVKPEHFAEAEFGPLPQSPAAQLVQQDVEQSAYIVSPESRPSVILRDAEQPATDSTHQLQAALPVGEATNALSEASETVTQTIPQDQVSAGAASIRHTDTSSSLRFRTQISYNFGSPSPVPAARGSSADTPALAARREVIRERLGLKSSSGRLQSLPCDYSNSLPPAPSQYPDTFRSAPPRPATPSLDLLGTPHQPLAQSSSTNQHSVMSLTQKLKSLREERRAKTDHLTAPETSGMRTRSGRLASPSFENEARSPSVIPHAHVVPMPTAEENRTSERFTTLVPQVHHEDSPSDNTTTTVSGNAESQQQASMKVNGSRIHVVPLYFHARQRDQYKQKLVAYREFLDGFRTNIWYGSENMKTIEKASEVAEALRQVTVHPDLLDPESFSRLPADAADQARFSVNSSTKFRFLQSLFDALAENSIHVVIDVQDKRLLEMLDTFLTGLGIQHHIGPGVLTQARNSGSKLSVTLLDTDQDGANVRHADVVIVPEGFRTLHAEFREDVRRCDDGSLAPVLIPMIPKSIEHVEHCMPVYADPAERLYVLLETTISYRSDAGRRSSIQPDADVAATAVAQYLNAPDISLEWPLDPVDDIEVQALPGPSQDPSTTATQHQPQYQSQVAAGTKRGLDIDNAAEQLSKRSRVGTPQGSFPPATISPQDIEIVHVSDLAAQDMQSISDVRHSAGMDIGSASHRDTEDEMQGKMSLLQSRLNEHVAALDDLQYRFEDQRAELVKTRVAKDDAYLQIQVVKTQFDNRETILSRIRTERDVYKQQADEAKAALINHDIPELAEFAKLKAANESLEKDKSKLDARVKSVTSDLDYIRNLYQDVSSKASAIVAERDELEERVGGLAKKASGEMARAQQATRETMTKALRADKKRLELMLRDREESLKRKDEEINRLKEAQRGRMGTRGTSVPRVEGRSPARLGSPMRLEPLRAGGSRANSPARKGSPAPSNLGLLGKSKLCR